MKNRKSSRVKHKSKNDNVCQFIGQSDHHTAGKVVHKFKTAEKIHWISYIQIREKAPERVNFDNTSYLDNRLELRDK